MGSKRPSIYSLIHFYKRYKFKMGKEIYYSDKYEDETHEYRHVILPKDMVKLVPKHKLMSESEWRNLGVTQSPGWIHYMLHEPEPHILLFKRPLPGKQPQAA